MSCAATAGWSRRSSVGGQRGRWAIPDPAEAGAPPPPSETDDRARLRDGDTVIFVDRKGRQYLRTLRTGRQITIRGASFPAEVLIGGDDGMVFRSPIGEYLHVLRPTFAQLVPHIPREAQVIYPKDIGTILLWGDIHPGARVVEVGVGPGATTMALLRAIGPEGCLTSYEIRDTFATMARANVARFHGPAPQWILKLRDAYDGLDERGIDRMVLDVSEPWRMVEHGAVTLRPGGVLVGFIPTVLQMKQLVDELNLGGFTAVEVLESLQRSWYVKDRSVRPAHRMVAHSGFIVIARRRAPTPTNPSDAPPND